MMKCITDPDNPRRTINVPMTPHEEAAHAAQQAADAVEVARIRADHEQRMTPEKELAAIKARLAALERGGR